MSHDDVPEAKRLDGRAPVRVRHETRTRLLQVRAVDQLSPHVIRVCMTGDMDGFASPGFDDHVKIFIPDPGEERPRLPVVGPEGPRPPDGGPAPLMRDYTPRRFDVAAGELVIDFAIHEAGPATAWAIAAAPGAYLGVGGPRGSFIQPMDFDWHLLIGDETALPAIARRLEELPAGARAVVLAEVDGPDDQLDLASSADVEIHWAHRHRHGLAPGQALLQTLAALRLPNGEHHTWIAGEAQAAKALRAQVIAQLGANPKWVKAAGYWRQGERSVHEKIED